MKRNPIIRTWLDDDSIIVDNFAGGGGASSGLELALGRSPTIAINHDPEAIAMHTANHPTTKHYIENVWQVDPVEACAGRKVGIMWMSPTCTFFSRARGGELSAETIKIRALAWIGIRWAATIKPRLIICENVVEWEKWGPVQRRHDDGCDGVACCEGCTFGKRPKNRRTGRDGKGRVITRHIEGCSGVACAAHCRIHQPIKSREGETFKAFVKKLHHYYKHVEYRRLRACDFGAPTTRERFFLQASDDVIRWPVATHGPGRAKPFRTAAECIDWSKEGKSIFDRGDKTLADKTLARIARGIKKFVLESARPFIVPPAYGDKGGTDVRVNSIDEPLRTVCGTRGGHAVVAPIVMKAKTYGGGGNDARSAEEPLTTVLTSKRGEHALAAATLVPYIVPNNTNNVPKGADEPVPAVTTGGRNILAAAYLVHRSNGERKNKDGTEQLPRVYDVAEPLRTVPAGGIKQAACVAMLVKHNGGNNDKHGSSGQSLDRPVDAIVGRNNKAVAVAHLIRYNGENSDGSARGQTMDEPTSTLDTSRRLGLVASHLVKLRGTSEAHVNASGVGMDTPMPTISTSNNGAGGAGGHLARIDAELAPLDTELAARAQQVAVFLGRYNGTGDAGLVTVTINGEEYVIVDIRMRMLEPRELFTAQGFAPDYKITPTWNGKPLTKTAQIRMCGNSVAPPVAAAIVRAALGLDATAEEGQAAA